MKTYLITEDELGAAELRAFTYDMALSTSGECVLLPYLLRSAHHRKCFHFTQNPVVSVTNKHPETLERRDVTGQKPFVTEHVVWSTPPLLIHLVKTAGTCVPANGDLGFLIASDQTDDGYPYRHPHKRGILHSIMTFHTRVRSHC